MFYIQKGEQRLVNNLILERRRVEITILKLNVIYLYNVKGEYQRTSRNCRPDEELDGCLAALCIEQPHVSGSGECDIVYKGEKLRVMIRRYIDLTFGELADIQAARMPDKEALVDTLNGQRFTYGKIKEYSDNLARSLIALGMEKGDHAAIIMDNSWENVIAKIAIEKAGGVIVNLNIFETPDVLGRLLFRADVRVILLRQGIKGQNHMESIYQICPELRMAKPGCFCCSMLPHLRHLIVTDRTQPVGCAWQFEQLLEDGRELENTGLEERQRAVTPFDDATIIHTSGTGGLPKGALLAYGQLIENAWGIAMRLGLSDNDRFCLQAPMFHILGSIGCIMTVLMGMGTLILHERPKRETLLSLLRQERCTILCSVTTIFVRLVRLMEKLGENREMLFLRQCVTAGASCPRQTVMDMKQVLGVDSVVIMYGMTESGPAISTTLPEDSMETVCSTVGGIMPGVSCRIIDPLTGQEADWGEDGEICVRGYGIMKEYYNNPKETGEIIDRDGWLHTGDMGAMKKDGNLIFKGRYKDIIIRGGENISAGEVEDFLRSHADISDAAVVGVPDEEYGENVYAFVCLKQGKSLEKEQLLRWCRGKIASVKIPQEIEFVESIPVSATGKLQKDKLRELARQK